MIKPITRLEFFCDSCGQDLKYNLCGNPFYQDEKGGDYCYNCALKQGLITPLEWLRFNFNMGCHHATFENGQVIGFYKCGRGFRKVYYTVKSSECDPERG